MRSLYILLVMALMIFEASSFMDNLQLINLPDFNKNSCDGNIKFWQDFYDKAKKAYPYASNRDLAKFITHDMLNDPNLDVMFVSVHLMNEDAKDDENSYYLFRDEFYGTSKEFLTFPYTIHKTRHCTLSNNFTLGMLNRNDTFTKEDSMIYDLMQKPSYLNTAFIAKQLSKKMESVNETIIDCPNHPEIQEIIEELEKMSLLPQEWTHLCIDKLKDNLKSKWSGASRGEITFSKNKMSLVTEGEGTVEEMTFCVKNRDNPRCKFCNAGKSPQYIFVYYMGSS